MSRNKKIKDLIAVLAVALHNREDMSFQQFIAWLQRVVNELNLLEELTDDQVIKIIRQSYLHYLRKGDRDASLSSSVVVSNESSSL